MMTKPNRAKAGPKKPLKIVRNVLAQPFQPKWPVVPEEDSLILTTRLDELRQRIPYVKTPWAELRRVGKPERSAVVEKFIENVTDEVKVKHSSALQARKQVFFGVNAVARALEQKSVACCLVANDVTPKSLVTHLITHCSNTNVPLLIVPNLKSVIKRGVGFKCMAMGLSSNCFDQNLKDFVGTVTQMHRSLIATLPEPKETLPEPPVSPSGQLDEFDEAEDPAMLPVLLYRSSTTYRAFVPDDIEPTTDQIGVNLPDVTMEVDRNHSSTRYFAPKVLRVQNNPLKPNKKKKKLK